MQVEWSVGDEIKVGIIKFAMYAYQFDENTIGAWHLLVQSGNHLYDVLAVDVRVTECESIH